MNNKAYRWAGPAPLPVSMISEISTNHGGESATYRYETDGQGRLVAVTGMPSLAAVETDLAALDSRPVAFDTDQDIYQSIGLALVRAEPAPDWSALTLIGDENTVRCVCRGDGGEEIPFQLWTRDRPPLLFGLGVLRRLIQRSGGGMWKRIRYTVTDHGTFVVKRQSA